MKFLKIFRFEFNYQLRNVSTWMYFTFVLGFAYLVLDANYSYDAREGYFLLNAPIVIATVSVLCIVHWLLIGASVAGDAAARDVQTRMHSLTYTTPASKAEYLGGRFLAALALNILIMLAIPMGILFAMYFSGVEPEILGPFRSASYLTAFFYIILPNVCIATAIQFSLATLSRKTMGSYLGGLILFVAAYLNGMILKGTGEWGNLLDPMSFTAIMSHLNDWSPLERNTRLFLLEGSFLANRLLWIGVSLGMLAFTYFRFSFVLPETDKKGKPAKHSKPDKVIHEKLNWGTGQMLPQIRGIYGLATHLRQLDLLIRKAFLQIAKSATGIPLLAVLALLMGIAGLGDGNLKARGVPFIPRTDQILHYLTANLTEPKPFWLIIVLLIIYYTGELVWRERETGMSEIANAAPVSDWVLLLSKYLGLSAILVVWLAFVMITGIVLQVGIGGASVEIGLYLKILFGLQLVDCLLFALLALFVHVLINQKFIGHLVAMLAYGFIVFSGNLGIQHKLLIFGASPAWSYTDMVGFGTSLAPWLWFKSYWLAWAVLLAVLTRLLWVRSREGSLKSRFHLARSRFASSTAWVAAASVGGILMVGGFIFYNTNVLNEYLTTAEKMEQKVAYEQRYRKYINVPQPLLKGINLQVEIYPKLREVEIHGTYHLVNNSTVAIDSIHLAPVEGVLTTNVTFDRPARSVLSDEKLGHRIYALAEPLKPGDSLRLSFDLRAKARSFTNNGADASVMENGTNFRNYDWLPAIGYQTYRELSDAGPRKKFKLPARPENPSLYNVNARKIAPFSERISFEAVVGTDDDQTAVAPGSLRRTWAKGGRRYFHYATDAPIRNEFNFFSASYALHESRWKNIAIQIYYDPGQTENLARMMRSVQASLEYYTQEFGPYPHRQIRFVAYSGYGFGNHSSPINITAGESFFLLDTKNDERGFDLVTAVVAHEVAHQWWGAQLTPARVEGGGILSESLAWYSAMGVVEDKYGSEQLRKLQSFLLEENENPRSRAALPLLQASDWYQYYRKGPFALYALSQYIGRERVNGALRQLLVKHNTGTPTLATSLDLYQGLKAATPDSLQYLLHDLFEKNTFWKLETKEATAKKTKTGLWQVTLNVEAHKFTVDSLGKETKLPMKDWIEIGIYAPATEGNKAGKQLYLQKHLIKSGKQTIILTIPQKPSRAGIDPNHLLIDWEMDDNSRGVKN